MRKIPITFYQVSWITMNIITLSSVSHRTPALLCLGFFRTTVTSFVVDMRSTIGVLYNNAVQDYHWYLLKMKEFSQSWPGCAWSCMVIDSSVYFSQPLFSHNVLHHKYWVVKKNTYWSNFKHLTPSVQSAARTWLSPTEDA